MRSEEKIEQELEFYKGCLQRARQKNPHDGEEISGYREKIELLRWVLGEGE